MVYEFNERLYRRGGGDGYLPYNKLCFEIFKEYTNKNIDKSYNELKEIFNSKHCSLNNIVQNREEWLRLTENQKKRYFEPIIYNNYELFFSTQWGNNGMQNGKDCDNVNHMIKFAGEENYDLQLIEEENPVINILNKKEIKIKNIILYGAPGVGKTHNYKKLISLIEQGLSQKDIFDIIQKNELNTNDNEIFKNDMFQYVKVTRKTLYRNKNISEYIIK